VGGLEDHLLVLLILYRCAITQDFLACLYQTNKSTTSRSLRRIEALAARVLGVKRVIRVSREEAEALITGCFASGLALGSFWSMAPVFARMLEFSKASTAIFMLLTIFGGLALVWPIGWLSDRMDRRQAITLLCAAGASTSLALVLVGVEFSPALMGLVTLFGGFTFPLYSISVAHANDFLEPDELISASSGLLLVYGAGAIIGPIMAGLIMGWMGAKGLYAMNAGVMGLIVLHAVYRMQMRATIPNEEQDAVVFIPRTTHVAYENDTLIIDSSDWPEAHTSGSPPSDEELCPNLVFEDLKRSGVSG